MSEKETQGSRFMPPEVQRGLINVQGGQQYLKAPFRVMWMREEHPDWGIETELVYADHERSFYIVKATVRNDEGRVIASAHSEEPKGKLPSLKKAETGAIARALALCGYGTQFGELSEEEPHVMGGMADAPDHRRHSTQSEYRPPNVDEDGVVHDNLPSRPPATPRQQAIGAFRKAARNIDERFGHPSFKAEDLAKMVKSITEDGREIAEIGKDLTAWDEAAAVLLCFKQTFPNLSAEDALKAIRYKYHTEIPMSEFTAAMWLSPFDDTAEAS